MRSLKRCSEIKTQVPQTSSRIPLSPVFSFFLKCLFLSDQVIYGPDQDLLRRHKKRLQINLKTLWHLQRKMIRSCNEFGVLSLRKKNSLGKKRVGWIIYHLYKLKSAEKAVLDQTLNHDCFYILILKIVTLQCGKISFAQKLDTGKDSAVKVPEASLFLLYQNRDACTT